MQEIPFIAAPIQTSTSLGIFNEFKLARLDLQGVHILLRIDLSGIEQELVRGNGEQRLCELTNGRNQKVLDMQKLMQPPRRRPIMSMAISILHSSHRYAFVLIGKQLGGPDSVLAESSEQAVEVLNVAAGADTVIGA